MSILVSLLLQEIEVDVNILKINRYSTYVAIIFNLRVRQNNNTLRNNKGTKLWKNITLRGKLNVIRYVYKNKIPFLFNPVGLILFIQKGLCRNKQH